MILNTGSRTDIPAYFSEWFFNRIKEGFVFVRNPYVPSMVYRYALDPSVVDCIVFCTKNPSPVLPRFAELRQFRTLWYVTLTPYGKSIEPYVPDKQEVLQSVRKLAALAGKEKVIWRYDPILLMGPYDVEYHKRAFAKIAETLEGSTERCVISFIDLYEKTKKNFPEVREVPQEQMEELTAFFAKVCAKHGMKLMTCLENHGLDRYGADLSGCMSARVIEECEGIVLKVPAHNAAREGCTCLLGGDIGAYNTCLHGCRYCYANYDRKLVEENARLHDPSSPMLVGWPKKTDEIKDALQKSWLDPQMRWEL